MRVLLITTRLSVRHVSIGTTSKYIDIQAPLSSECKLVIVGVENCGRRAWSSNRGGIKITAAAACHGALEHLPPLGGGTVVDQRRHGMLGEQATSDAADSPTVPGKPTCRWWYWSTVEKLVSTRGSQSASEDKRRLSGGENAIQVGGR